MTRLVIALLALVGCAAPEKPVALAGKVWTAIEIGGEPTPDGLTEPITLRTDGGQVSGFAGCNTYGGSAAVSGAKVQFLQLVSTKKACLGDGVMAAESAYLEALGAAASASLDAQGRLLLLSESGEALAVFTSP